MQKIERFYRPFFYLALVALFLFLLCALVYGLSPTGRVSRTTAYILPFPAATVDGKVVRMYDFLVEYQAVASDNDDNEAVRSSILNKLIERKALALFARRLGVTVDEIYIQQARDRIVGEPTDFGWSKKQFEDRIIFPIALAMALEKHVAQNEDFQRPARELAQTALDRLRAGDDFVSVAGDMSEDRFAIQGGARGFVTVTSLPQEWRNIAASIPIGTDSDLIETSDGYYLLRISDRVNVGKEGESVQLSAMSFFKKPLDTILKDYMNSIRIRRFVAQGG